MKNIDIQTVPVEQIIKTGIVRTNSYILKNIKTNEAVLIDPGADSKQLLEEFQKQNLELKAILLTHGHFDHISAAKEIKEQFKVNIYVHSLEQNMIQNCVENCSEMYGVPIAISSDNLFEDKQVLEVAGMEIEVIHISGHTPGSSCFYLKEIGCLFSGDTLLFKNVGRTDLAHSNREKLLSNIRRRLFVLPEEVIVYPGHRSCTYVGYEKRHNPHLKI